MTGYWPWWLGALALGGITWLHWVLTGWGLGVSGSWGRALKVKEARAQDAFDRALKDDAAAMEAALLAETAAEFGAAALTAAPAGTPALPELQRERTPWGASVFFLLMLAAGGLLSSVVSGGVGLQLDLGATHTALLGEGPWRAGVLAVGGVLVGFGTRMAGGCTTGHGLSGMARLQVGSIVSTASFLGAAVGVSFLLAAMVSR